MYNDGDTDAVEGSTLRGCPGSIELIEEGLEFFDGGFAGCAGTVPVTFRNDAIDAQKGLEQQFRQPGVFLCQTFLGSGCEGAEKSGVCGSKVCADCVEFGVDGCDLDVLCVAESAWLLV